MPDELIIKIEVMNNGYIVHIHKHVDQLPTISQICITTMDVANFVDNYLMRKTSLPNNELV